MAICERDEKVCLDGWSVGIQKYSQALCQGVGRSIFKGTDNQAFSIRKKNFKCKTLLIKTDVSWIELLLISII